MTIPTDRFFFRFFGPLGLVIVVAGFGRRAFLHYGPSPAGAASTTAVDAAEHSHTDVVERFATRFAALDDLHDELLRGALSRDAAHSGPSVRDPHADRNAEPHFVDSATCKLCHSVAWTASAMWSSTGDDVSPYGLWRSTMMANSFRDPYWRAQVSKEVEGKEPEDRARIEALCLTCHGPAAHHQARLDGAPSPGVQGSEHDAFARDGVTCTVCHQARGEVFGTAASFSGGLDIRADKKIFGPYENPAFQPMLMHTGYRAEFGAHIRDAGLCGSCHTLHTTHVSDAEPFPEQTPYLEWRNSEFSNEAGETATSRTCQECHMPELAPSRIARNPAGLDFNIPVRAPYRGHAFVGGNAFMLELLAENAEELGVEATPDELIRTARATRRQLAHSTARIEVVDAKRDGDQVSFGVRVHNDTGHKLPTGYPARRAWLQVSVRSGRDEIFGSGAFDSEGRLVGVGDPRRIPHYATIEREDQVQVFEAIPVDAAGEPTTYLTRMARMGKDNRLLPRGWRADGPHSSETRPVGTAEDADFVDGADTTHYRVTVPADARGRLTIVAWLRYQPVPPAWVDPLRGVDSDEARDFVRMYDAASKAPETMGVTVHSLR